MKKILRKATKVFSARGDGFRLGKVITVGVLMVTFLASMTYVMLSGLSD